MITPFLFVGCGGSGIQVLRRLRRELEYRLRVAEWTGPFPSAWQFLAVDVPQQEDSSSELRQFSHNSYVGLADGSIGYRGPHGADDQLASRASVQDDFAAWRPNPVTVNVDVTKGAGQFRAVGRAVVALWGDDALAARIQGAKTALQAVDAQLLYQLGETLRVPAQLDARRPDPVVILVSSLAGGAGSGTFLDIADMLRRASDSRSQWLTRSIGFLFDPSVFRAQGDLDSSGMPANSLGAVSELVAGRWAPWTSFPYAPSLVGDPGTHRGTEFTFLLGSGGGESQFESTDAVYQSTAQLLASWTLNPDIGSRLTAHIQGNWSALSLRSTSPVVHDPTLTNGNKALSSMGYSRLSLGRDRFGTYAAERLTRALLDRVLSLHIDDDVRAGRISEDEAVRRRVDRDNERLVDTFIDDCRLNERSRKNNQVLDDIRVAAAERAKVLSELQDGIRKKVTSAQNVIGQYNEAMDGSQGLFPGAFGKVQGMQLQLARDWSEAVQARVQDAVCRLLATEGLPVTAEVVRRAAGLLRQDFPAELRGEAEALDREVVSTIKAARELVKGAVRRRDRTVPSGAMDVVMSLVATRLEKDLEIDLLGSVADLLVGVAEHVLDPVAEALEDLLGTLKQSATGQELESLAGSTVPTRLHPAPNELLVEPVESYPKVFDEKVAATTGTLDEALVQVAGGLIGAVKDSRELPDHWRPWTSSPWVPDLTVAGKRTTPATLVPSFHFTLGDVLRRASAWLREDPQTPMGGYMNETFRSYLASEDVPLARRRERGKEFAALLAATIDKGQPLAALDSRWVAGQYKQSGTVLTISKMPVAAGEPAFNAVDAVLRSRLPVEQQGTANYDTDATGDVEVYTYLWPLSPAAFSSLSQPIVASYRDFNHARRPGEQGSFWRSRRARRLLDFVPLPPSTRLTLARGFLTARLTGRIDDSGTGCVVRTGPRAALALLEPPLGAPADKFEWFAMALESALLAEMLAANGQPEHFEALCELLRLGTHDGSDVPSLEYPTRHQLLSSEEVVAVVNADGIEGAEPAALVTSWLTAAVESWEGGPAFVPSRNYEELGIGEQVLPLLGDAANQILAAGPAVVREKKPQRFGS